MEAEERRVVFNNLEIIMIKLVSKSFHQISTVISIIMGGTIHQNLVFADYRDEFLKLKLPVESEGFDYFIVKKNDESRRETKDSYSGT
jgi:hypothetical protein